MSYIFLSSSVVTITTTTNLITQNNLNIHVLNFLFFVYCSSEFKPFVKQTYIATTMQMKNYSLSRNFKESRLSNTGSFKITYTAAFCV